MQLIKPKFWDKKIGFISIILLPLTLIYLTIVYFKKKFVQIKSFEIPIICVGNIYLGGTGKTPTSILLANELQSLGKNPAILRKFYKNHNDEYDLIKNSFKNLILDKNRIAGIIKAEKLGFDTIILDDGLQDYRIHKTLSIVCFNQSQLVGNGLAIPSGPLRESLNALSNADIVIVNGERNISFEDKILRINKKLKIFYSFYKPTNLESFKNKKILALAGIGNPENFFQLLEKNNLKIEKKIIIPDHYVFSKKEFLNIINDANINNYHILMTEKDYFKVKSYTTNKIDFLKVNLIIKNREKLLSLIKERM
jgi:tetraacyldisaccharide 4'-kinase